MTVLAAPDIYAKFKWHIESRQCAFGKRLNAGNVMNAVLALANDSGNLLDPYLSAVRPLRGDSWPESALYHREYQDTKQRQVVLVKRAVNEDAFFKVSRRKRHDTPPN